ncbi:MAG TPA: hypothetical protein VMX16_06700 [Terriglobia bacterium]|nr:hypothetical protein [Terriglobia bacterium]
MKKLLLGVMAISTFMSLAGSALMAQGAGQEVPATASEAAKAKTVKHHSAAASMETLSGTISMVDTHKKVVVVTDSNGIPFDLKVTGATHIMVSGKKAKLADLSDATSKQATVKYRAEKQAGDIATSIEVGG